MNEKKDGGARNFIMLILNARRRACWNILCSSLRLHENHLWILRTMFYREVWVWFFLKFHSEQGESKQKTQTNNYFCSNRILRHADWRNFAEWCIIIIYTFETVTFRQVVYRDIRCNNLYPKHLFRRYLPPLLINGYLPGVAIMLPPRKIDEVQRM